ncbi:uncharacterized protein LOC128866151 isoform X2 [Anastrepha ludens]|uniref:uncharacterized protein LOC128866151 isoform X2 n=1 Tax=Anastrepha ludens TaxID=28586 RepID=UPI0023B17B61|nr:uncharacterized protein LOC128866151 isoform X2 [Anastrepha ludens]
MCIFARICCLNFQQWKKKISAHGYVFSPRISHLPIKYKKLPRHKKTHTKNWMQPYKDRISKTMNSSAYDANVVHHEHSAVQHQTPSGHPAHRPNIVPALSSFYHSHASSIPISSQQQTAQLQLTAINTGGNNRSQVTSNSPPGAAQAAALFDPRQVHLANALEKTFFNTSAAGMQTSGQRFYSGVPSTVAASGGTNPVNQITQQQHHHHQQGNTILITNNFSAHQYGTATPQVAEVSARATTGIVGGVVPAVTTATGSYNNGNAGNIRIITTLPSTLHHQQQQQIYNIAKEVEATVRDDIIQLPQFYHTPHQQSSTYAQHLPTILPTHYTQQQFVATTTAPTSLQISQDDTQQQQQFFMSMTNDGEGAAASSATLTSIPKLIPTLTGEATTSTDAVTTSPTIITSPATTTNSNSTLVLDRINICINNHYSDSLAANNGLSTTTLDSNATTTTAAITPVAHTFPMATHAPQQPSPIIPAIHHKVLLDSVGGGGGNGGLHTDSYASNDSTLVIDEPDSTTTTPHTPPTATENNSPPPRTLNLSSTRTTVPPQSMTTQNVIGDTFVSGKENYIVSPTTICIPTIKALVNKEPDKAPTCPPGHTFTTITQSINLIDDDESDYANSDVNNGTETEGVENTEDAVDNIIVEIEGNEVDLSTPEKICLKNNTKSDRTISPSLTSKTHNIGGLLDSSRETDMKELKLDYPQAPIPVKILQTAADGTASSVALMNQSIPTTSLPCLQDSLRVEKKVTIAPLPSPEICFSMGEDVFIRKDDGRQYLGTVIGSSAGGGINQPRKMQYLVRFDDNSELWCSTKEMRRLGGSGGIGNTQMCVACKRTQEQDVVETCDDCRRGYHRNCTRETTPGSGVWWCLRCSKPMKEQPHCTSKSVCKSHLHHNRCYKNSCDASKTSPSSQKIKTPADVYEFDIEDNEIFTSDDEIPIKHIMEKARKSRDSAQNSNASSMRPKTIKKLKSSEAMLCEKIAALDDENANDANSVGKIPEAPQKEKVNDKDGLSGIPSQSTNCITSLKQGTEESEVHGKIIDSIHGPKTVSSVYNKVPSMAIERSSRKRKAFTLSNSYKEIAAEAASKRYDSSRICDSSSDENSSSSRGTSLDVIIPPPKNFLGLNNPFRMVTPKKNFSTSYVGGASAGCMQRLLNFNCGGTMIKSSIFNTTALDFSSKLAALKSAGIFPNLSTSNLAKGAGQPRTVRTIKRRLSAKDITIGPNQEVRRRRTRRLSSNIEIISTTTINPIPSNFFPIHAKDLFSTHTQHTTTSRNMSSNKQQHQQSQQQATSATSASVSSISSPSSASSSPPGSITSSVDSQVEVIPSIKPSHGRRLRQRPQKNSPVNSRRSSVSSASTASSTNSSSNITLATLQQQQQALHTNSNKNTNNMNASATSMHDLKQSVKEYFGGALNRIESGEHFCIRAKRQLANGQMEYLIEWGDVAALPHQGPTTHASIACPTSTTVTLKNDH